MKCRRAYRGIVVNHVDWQKLAKGRDGQRVLLGIDVGKYELRAVVRWPDGRFERPWRIDNPGQIRELIGLLEQVRQGRELMVALEPSGTYGDTLRHALHVARIEVRRVSPKAAHDHAEVFDGVPSQHDGKDAAVVAELAAIGKSSVWAPQPIDPWEQELAYWVDRMTTQRQQATLCCGRLEGLLSRHWPEATRVLKLASATLLRALASYGGPAALAADDKAAAKLARWGGAFLSAAKVEELLASARSTIGVPPGDWQCRQVREYAAWARGAAREFRCCQRNLKRLTRDHALIQAQGHVVGVPTACVLWVYLGDPRDYYCAGAYRKAMGLNLTERSSGIYQGKLKISKRGHPQTRHWLYLAALRLVKRAGAQSWYQAKKAKDGQAAGRALVAVMRKLALALYQVSAGGERFDEGRLFRGIVRKLKRPDRADIPAQSSEG